MANYSVDITATRSATIMQTTPTTNYSTGNEIVLPGYYGSAMVACLLGFPVASELTGRRISGLTLFLDVVSVSNWASGTNQRIWGSANSAEWVEGSVTYANAPAPVPEQLLSVAALPSPLSPGLLDAAQAGLVALKLQLDNGFLYSENGLRVRMDSTVAPQPSMTIRSSRAASGKPFLRMHTEDAQPEVFNALPSGAAYRNPLMTIEFMWSIRDVHHETKHVYGNIQTTGSKFRYREIGAGTYTEIVMGDNLHAYEMPADIFDAGKDYEWQVIETTTDGMSSTGDTWYAFTTTDATPQQAIAVSPADVYIEIDKDQEFEWQHIIDSGTPQTQVDLQYSLAGGAWTTFATVSGADTTTIIPADTLPGGQLRWRVRTYNQDGVPGEWSSPAFFVGIGSPPMPTFSSITNAARPIISWQSTGQQGYELQILQGTEAIWQTGETAGVEKSRKVPVYLPNGEYTARLRIIGATLVWSAWAELAFEIGVTPPEAPTISAELIPDGARITISAYADGIIRAYLLRNGVPVSEITGLTTYDDLAALGGTRYAIRTVDEYDNYTDSDDVYVTVTVAAPSLAAVDALDEPVILKHTRGEPRRMIDNFSTGVSYHYYAGRKKPVTRKSGFEAESHELSVAFLDSAARDALIALVRRGLTLLYRDNWGNRWYCDVSALPGERDKLAATVTLTMVVVDYVEAIPYAEV